MRRRAISFSLVAVALLVALVAFRPHSSGKRIGADQPVDLPDGLDLTSASLQEQVLGLATAPKTAVYPYSVVPGGVHSVNEFAGARAKDPVVAKHYEDVSLATLRVEQVDKPRAAYMSYRKGGQIYWTKNKLPLKVGEEVLTDGDTTIRGRCGNRLSEVPMLPTSGEEPSLAAFDRTIDAPGGGQPDMFAPGGTVPVLAALAPQGAGPGGNSGPSYFGGGGGGGGVGGGGGGGGVGGGGGASGNRETPSTPNEGGVAPGNAPTNPPGDSFAPDNPGSGGPAVTTDDGPKGNDNPPTGGPGPNGSTPDVPPPGDGGPGPNGSTPPGGGTPPSGDPNRNPNPDPPVLVITEDVVNDPPPGQQQEPIDSVPEPASLMLIGTGAAWALRRYRARR